MVKFIDCNFHGKERFQNSVRRKIYGKLGFEIWETALLSTLAIERYLDILIEETDFNIKSKVFYDKISNTKISYNLFAKIATEYILEHINDFAVDHLKAGLNDM
ncbi:MAG: hypothetical protein IJI96_02655 [Methanobrevibacter sp.]|nr:hypothetical protein [Methanobrevibacter sp.]MBQ6627407.1 hypothetical protein [Methanobrevibacter sp.]